MRSTTAPTISGAGCGSVTIHAPSSPGRLALAIEISGVLVSRATAAIARAPGEPAVPMTTSTLSSSISLRALRAAVEGSEPSSSWTTWTLRPPTSDLYATPALMPFSYGIPSEDTGPDSEVMKPTFRSAAATCADSPTVSTAAAAIRMSFFKVMSSLRGKKTAGSERQTADARTAADIQDLAGDEAVGRVGEET